MKWMLLSISFILPPSSFRRPARLPLAILLMRSLVFLFVFTAAASLALLAYVALLSRHKKSSSRPLRLVGRVARVERPLSPEGFVLLDGELWRARLRGGEFAARAHGRVRVTGARGCVLEVEPLA
jgi:membrane protein implicated in regulation of membrane protease activity